MIDAQAHAREAFNRAAHSDALREMQFGPAEEQQSDGDIVGSHPWLAVPIAFVLGVLLTIVAAHA